MSLLEEKLSAQVGRRPHMTVQKENSIKQLLNSPAIKNKFEEMLDRRAPQYITSIINLYNTTIELQKVEPMSVIASCIVAATMDLPIDKNLGYAWVVPYSGKAQFQLGYKGFVQLALRSAKYKSINVIGVHEGELQSWNPLTEEIEIDFEKRKSNAVVGYAGYFELITGFKKTVYWSKEQIEAHRAQYCKSGFGWNKHYDEMAQKTLIRHMLSKWGIMSIEMQKAHHVEAEPEQTMKEMEDMAIDLSTNEYQEVSSENE